MSVSIAMQSMNRKIFFGFFSFSAIFYAMFALEMKPNDERYKKIRELMDEFVQNIVADIMATDFKTEKCNRISD